jgi:prepilin-type N-terminal cleavage/methylation domain-containing protein
VRCVPRGFTIFELLIVLAILVALAAPHEGIRLVAPGLAAAVIVAALMDVVILRRVKGEWEFPSGAVLTGGHSSLVIGQVTNDK